MADTPLDPGRYIASIQRAPSAPLLPVLSVPEGYLRLAVGEFGVARDDDQGAYIYLWLWNVNAVYTHPCDEAAGGAARSVGPTVADLANALAAQPLTGGDEPVPVTVGGYDGLYVELSVPDDAVFGGCPHGAFNLWDGRVQQHQGQVDMIWIVDVEGGRIVFDASYESTTSPELVAELKNMVATATFTPAEGT